VEVGAGAIAEVTVDLPEIRDRAPAGRLSINTRPWSKVYVGTRLLGTTPIGEEAVPSGTVRLRLVDRDGNTHNRTVEVRAGDETRVFFDLTE
jgi:serine/threonine-protein kinase